jgi:hypothetical protein
MASPNTLALREEMTGLGPRRYYLNRPRTPKQALPGEFADLTRQAGAQAKTRRRQTRAALTAHNDQARGFERQIPTSGPGRRRAKARRNAQAAAGQ